MAHGQDEEAGKPDEIHVSPDGALRLVVSYGCDPMLGFAGFAWHVHANASEVAAWAGDILSGKRAIIEAWKDGVRLDAWTPEHNDFDFEAFVAASRGHGDPAEQWRQRRWGG